MLELTIKEDEVYIPKENKFIKDFSCTLTLEHSLISISKWESRWHVPYLSEEKRTTIQELDYIKCMSITPIKNEYVFNILSQENIETIREYIENPMTATTFSNRNQSRRYKKEKITSETLYSRMFAHNIPIECQKWHLNRLLTLLRVCDLNGAPREKMSKQQTAQWYSQQNALRRAKYHTRG